MYTKNARAKSQKCCCELLPDRFFFFYPFLLVRLSSCYHFLFLFAAFSLCRSNSKWSVVPSRISRCTYSFLSILFERCECVRRKLHVAEQRVEPPFSPMNSKKPARLTHVSLASGARHTCVLYVSWGKRRVCWTCLSCVVHYYGLYACSKFCKQTVRDQRVPWRILLYILRGVEAWSTVTETWS